MWRLRKEILKGVRQRKRRQERETERGGKGRKDKEVWEFLKAEYGKTKR